MSEYMSTFAIPEYMWCRMAKGLLRMGPTYGITAVQPNGAQLQKISDMAADGKVKVILDRTYPLIDAPYAPFTLLHEFLLSSAHYWRN